MPEPDEQVMQEIDKVLDDFADRIFQISQANLANSGRVDTGNLLKTANVNKEFLNKEIVYPAPYADIVEFGRAAGGKVYAGWLEGWVRRKLGINDEAEVKRVAFAIAKAIEQRGIQPSPYLGPAVDQAKAEYNL